MEKLGAKSVLGFVEELARWWRLTACVPKHGNGRRLA
jgi:hypothetical protein